jgi:hypothetical protein
VIVDEVLALPANQPDLIRVRNHKQRDRGLSLEPHHHWPLPFTDSGDVAASGDADNAVVERIVPAARGHVAPRAIRIFRLDAELLRQTSRAHAQRRRDGQLHHLCIILLWPRSAAGQPGQHDLVIDRTLVESLTAAMRGLHRRFQEQQASLRLDEVGSPLQRVTHHRLAILVGFGAEDRELEAPLPCWAAWQAAIAQPALLRIGRIESVKPTCGFAATPLTVTGTSARDALTATVMVAFPLPTASTGPPG